MADYLLLARHCVLFALLIAAATTDLTQGKVYNWCTFPGVFLAGDVKLITAVGALGGMQKGYVVYALFYSAIVGALISVAVLLWNRRLWQGLKGSLRFMASLAPRRRSGEGGEKAEGCLDLTIPYGAAIAIGSMVAWFVVELP